MKKVISLTVLGLLLGSSSVWGADNTALEKQMQELVQQNKMLMERVTLLEEILVGKQPHEHQKALAEKVNVRGEEKSMSERLQQVESVLAGQEAGGAEDEGASLIEIMGKSVGLSGLVEVEAHSSESYDDEETSDITLATVEIGLEAHITDWSHANIVLLYEEGEDGDELLVDEGTITLGNLEKFPAFLTVGKMYLPFGSYLTNMISDTLPLELGEISDSAAQIGFEAAGFYGSMYVFNGDIYETGEDDKIDNFGFNLGYVYESDGFTLDAGADWLNNIADTNGLGDFLEGVVGGEIDDYVEGFAAHLLVETGPFTFAGEYLTALDSFQVGELDFNGAGAEPEAWSLEASMTTELLGRETTFSLGYQGSDEALALELPEERYLATVRMMILENTSLALEYLHDEDYDKGDDGTGDDADALTMQLAVEF